MLLLQQQAGFSNAASMGPAYTTDSCMGLTGDQLQQYMAGPWSSYSSLNGNSMFADADALLDTGLHESIFACPPLQQQQQAFPPLSRTNTNSLTTVPSPAVPANLLAPAPPLLNTSVPPQKRQQQQQQQHRLHHQSHRIIGNAGMAPIIIPPQVVTSLPLLPSPNQHELLAQQWQQTTTLIPGASTPVIPPPAVTADKPPAMIDSAQLASQQQLFAQLYAVQQKQTLDHSGVRHPCVPFVPSSTPPLTLPQPAEPSAPPLEAAQGGADASSAAAAASRDALEAWMASLESTGGVAAEFGTGSVTLGLSPSLSCADMTCDLLSAGALAKPAGMELPAGILPGGATDDPTPPTEPFLLTFLSHLTSTTTDESFPIPSTAAQAPILPRRPTTGAVANPPALLQPLQPQPIADLLQQTASAAAMITEVVADHKLLEHGGVIQKKASPSSAHDCCAAPVLPMLQQGRGSRGGSQHGALAGLMGLGLRRHVGSGASSNGMQAGGLAGPMGDEDAHTNKFARRNSHPGKSQARPHAKTAEQDTASSGQLPGNSHLSSATDTATATPPTTAAVATTRKRPAIHHQDAAMALLDELGGGTPSTDTSDGSGSRSDGGSGSSDGGSNEGSNDVGCPLELESPLLPTPAGQSHHTSAAAHQQPHTIAGHASAAAVVHPVALIHPPMHGSEPAAVACTAGDQPAAKRTRLDHSPPATAEPLPHCVTGASDSPLRRSLDLVAGSDGLAGMQSGAGSNQAGCAAGSAQGRHHAASQAVMRAGTGGSGGT
ncbi:MAG: hypothetical protein WDW38_004407 [Sanguina aurantia]